MRQLGTLFEKEKKNVYRDATLKNYEGFPAFETSMEDRVLQTLMTGNFQDTFYVGRKKLAKEAIDLFVQMSKQDPVLFGKMIVYARNQGYIRAAPITALAILSRESTEASNIFGYVIRTPNDLKDFIELCRGPIRKIGRQIKSLTDNYLNNLSEYHAIKYGARGSGSFSLGDVLRLARPIPLNERQSNLFKYLIYGTDSEKEVSLEGLNQIQAFENLKKATTLSEKMEWIEKGRLPHEVTTVFVGEHKELWPAILRQMPYFALLRHLNTLHRADVLEGNQKYVSEKLKNRGAILNAKVFPYQLQLANVFLEQGAPRSVRDALAEAVEISFDNIPFMNQKICIAPDVSGSMYRAVSDRSKTQYIDIATLFAAALWKRSQDSFVWPVDTHLHNPGPMPSGTPLTNFAHMMSRFGGGGTEFSLPLQKLLKDKTKIDVFVTITDGEEWYGRGFLEVVREYRKEINPNLQSFLVRIDPYSRYDNVPQDEPGCHRIMGWSDVVLTYISRILTGTGNQIDNIKFLSASELAGRENVSTNKGVGEEG